jgi:hypothetical protein
MARKFFTPINLTGLELTNFKIQNLGDNPTAYGAGHTYYNTAAKELRVYDGAAWIPVGGSVGYGDTASRPAAGNSGRIYVDTQAGILYIDNGTTWDQIGEAEGAAAAAQSAAESYADSLAVNYDPAGSAATAEDNAKAYADAIAQGLFVIGAVKTASTANIADLTTVTSVGGYTLGNGDRVLLKNQSTATQNGIYIYTLSTTTLTKSTNVVDADIKEGSYTFVEEGTHAAQGWIVTAYSTGASTWTQFSAAGQYLAGTGIDISGIYISQDTANGYGIRKYSETIGDETTLNYTITHNFNTKDVNVTVYDTATDEEVFTGVEHPTVNTVTVKFAVAPDEDAFRVVVVG